MLNYNEAIFNGNGTDMMNIYFMVGRAYRFSRAGFYGYKVFYRGLDHVLMSEEEFKAAFN